MDPSLFNDLKSQVRCGIRLSDTRFGRPSNEDYTVSEEDMSAIVAAAELHFEAAYTFEFFALSNWLAGEVYPNIDTFGDDGRGNKPEDMNRFTYWIQHIEFTKIQEQADHIRSLPLIEVFQATKKLPCSVCKSVVTRGGLAVYTCDRHGIRRGPEPNIDGKPSRKRNFCPHPECLGKMKFPGFCRNASVVNSATGEEALDLVAQVQSIQRSASPYPLTR